jgi:phosphoribosylformylglycinamidine synthase
MQIFRISIDTKEKSSEAKALEKKLKSLGYNLSLEISKVYTIQYDFSEEQIKKIADALHNPVVETTRVNQPFRKEFSWALELGFLPGVTDNVANTTTEIINDLFKIEIGRNKVFTSKVLFIKADNLRKQDIEFIAKELINTLIERFHIKSYEQYTKDNGMDCIAPEVKLEQRQYVAGIGMNADDEELLELGKKGIPDPITKTRRGPLALDLDYLHAIQKYFKKQGRKATDIEIESIAQTWSEHCKHTIFAGEMDDIKEGLFSRFIKGATEKIRQDLGENDFCLSVFKDNSGAIILDKNYMITDKVETHNSPSALDPFGGAITGIVGVNRDTIGFGLGALPIANKYGFCLGRPEDKSIIYRGEHRTNPALTTRRVMDGVIYGVNVGGNCSGIPTPAGFVYFDDSYKGKPLIFVGTVGLIPRKINRKPGHEKKAQAGDNIVMIGGRVGKDGIHGATFSSEAMDSGSPAAAVQIGDPITQKKLSDAVVKEARDKGLYSSITDNGAGGLSCSVAEMAKECGGFTVNLEKVPLKYPGLQPWEIWISESQERMTLAVPDENLEEFMNLMKIRGVEATVTGKFNDSNKAVVKFKEKEILNLDMDFLHNGLPKRKLTTKPYPYNTKEPFNLKIENHQELFEKILGNHNNCSFEFIPKQYDHEVQNNSAVKPLQGKGRVNSPASVIKPLFNSKKGVVLSQALYPRLSQISCYDMAACAIDTAIRNCIAVGGNINHLALLDNFCWCSSDEPERLAQLKDTAKACYDYAVAYKTPFISGKDSMFNDFKGFDNRNNPIKISVLPTLLISSIGVIEDVNNTCTIDFKSEGDLIYVIGETRDECGAGEFYHAFKKIGAKSPKVNAKTARELYEKMYELHKKGILSACASVNQGGLLITLAKMAIAGQLGAEIDIKKAPNLNLPIEKICYSETQSRFIIAINPKNRQEFENIMQDFVFAQIGFVKNETFIVNEIIKTDIKKLGHVYKERFKEF